MITVDPKSEPCLAQIIEKLRNWTKNEKKRGDIKIFVKDGAITRFIEERVSTDLLDLS